VPEFRTDRPPHTGAALALTSTLLSAAAAAEFGELCRKSVICRAHGSYEDPSSNISTGRTVDPLLDFLLPLSLVSDVAVCFAVDWEIGRFAYICSQLLEYDVARYVLLISSLVPLCFGFSLCFVNFYTAGLTQLDVCPALSSFWLIYTICKHLTRALKNWQTFVCFSNSNMV